jgi:AraC family transcriptional regulator
MPQRTSMEPQTPGAKKKYPHSALLLSSAGLGWSSISAELWSHGTSERPVTVPLHTEVTLAVSGGEECLVRRTGTGQRQEAVARTGTVCLHPIGIGDAVTITAPIPKVMHLSLPTTLFTRLSDEFNLPGRAAQSIRYLAGLRDEMISQIGLSLLSEMARETAAGRMFAETASLMLAARLIHEYSDSESRTPIGPLSLPLGHVRLRRALDYISAHLADEITLTDIARIAGVSTFHFARMFTLAVGVPPHRHISRLRLEKAMAEIAAGRLPLAQIAMNARFSSQASFTRAFRRATGVTPGEYRRARRSASRAA